MVGFYCTRYVRAMTNDCFSCALTTDCFDAFLYFGVTNRLATDLVSAYGASILSLVDVDSIANVLQRGRRAKSSRTKNLAVWATKEIRKLKNVAHNVDLAAVSGSSVTPSGCSTAQAS
ncbi:hypothetical protein T265_03383 [Opisthorchis viverrini]|uniref:Uncharacterized protein n=1 Tax=Opisthorchis viverrini TaxID=6198 RepID=A0A074ZRS5_OPIVI|nr:hypothetical protein T265_03383 [Opisthorchis viverrini]KER30118.1 hypothetical protein T265_03383 [Opisthorchis viverrini]